MSHAESLLVNVWGTLDIGLLLTRRFGQDQDWNYPSTQVEEFRVEQSPVKERSAGIDDLRCNGVGEPADGQEQGESAQ